MTTFVLIKYVIGLIAVLFVPTAFFMATRGGFYNSSRYHGNGSAH